MTEYLDYQIGDEFEMPREGKEPLILTVEAIFEDKIMLRTSDGDITYTSKYNFKPTER